jgi:hypothetical protein
VGTDWRDSQIRYLVHFSDGGRRHVRRPGLIVGDQLIVAAADTLSVAPPRRRQDSQRC